MLTHTHSNNHIFLTEMHTDDVTRVFIITHKRTNVTGHVVHMSHVCMALIWMQVVDSFVYIFKHMVAYGAQEHNISFSFFQGHVAENCSFMDL